MIKKMVVYTAERYPEYSKKVYRNVSRDEAERICKQVQRDMSVHKIKDFQIEVAE